MAMLTKEKRKEFAMFHDYWYSRQRSTNMLWFVQKGHDVKMVNHLAHEFFGDLLEKDCSEFPPAVRQAILMEKRRLLYDILTKVKRVLHAPDTSRKYAGDATLLEVVTAAIAETTGEVKSLRAFGIGVPVEGVKPFWRNPMETIHGLADRLISVYERDLAPQTPADEENRQAVVQVIAAYVENEETDLSPLVGARIYTNAQWITTLIDSGVAPDKYTAFLKVLGNYRLIRQDIE